MGNKGTVLHCDGAGWSPFRTGTTAWLIDIQDGPSSDILNGRIRRFRGPPRWKSRCRG